MINIIDKQTCCGCSACASICPKQCIRLQDDNEGFFYPKVEVRNCVNCGLCDKVCNMLNPYEKREPLKVFASINKNDEIRLNSSSGGIFYNLASQTIQNGGVVFGARFDKTWQVVIDYAEDMKGVVDFMGSKYVQSRIEDSYKNAKKFLQQGRQVLFSGTPCQIAGLHKYLRVPYDNLISVDFICHGTPSPKVWGYYLKHIVDDLNQISMISFRNKLYGWKNFSFVLKYSDGEKKLSFLLPHKKDLYMKAFLQDIILRPSCYACKSKDCSSQSDITIADFWGVHKLFPGMDDDKGTGLVLLNTDKGVKVYKSGQFLDKETTYENVKSLNPASIHSAKLHPKRDVFFSRLDQDDLLSLIEDCTKLTFKQRLYDCVDKWMSLLYCALKKFSRAWKQ